MSTARKVLSNTLWQFISKFMVAALGLLTIKITTQYLSQGGTTAIYGQYTAVYEYLAYFGIIADLGLYTIAVKEMSKDQKQIPKIIGNVLSLRLILVSATMIIASILVFQIPKYSAPGSHIPIGVAIASLTVFFTILNGTITSVLQTKYQMKQASIAVVLGKIVTVLYMLYVIFYGYPTDIKMGFYMMVSAGIFGALLTLFITYRYVRKITPIRPRFDLDIWHRIMVQSLPYGIALILSTIYFRLDTIVIFMSRGEEELGLYAPAMKLLEQFTILPLYFMNSVLPILAQSIKEKTQQYKAIIRHSFDVLAAISFPMLVGGALLAYPIIELISTEAFLSRPGFTGSDVALQILMFALLFQFLNVLFAFILISIDQQKKLLYINAACVIFNLVTNVIFIPKYGFAAAAVTSVLSEAFILIGNYIVAKRNLDFTLSYKNLLKITCSAIIMGLAIYPLRDQNVLLTIAIGAAVYVTMIVLTKTIDKNTLKLILKK